MVVYSGTDEGRDGDTARKKGMGGLCTLSSKKKRPFIGEKRFFEHFGFKAVDEAGDYELLALTFDGGEPPRFCDSARAMRISQKDFTIFYTPECPYAEHEVKDAADALTLSNDEDGVADFVERLMENDC